MIGFAGTIGFSPKVFGVCRGVDFDWFESEVKGVAFSMGG